MTFNIISDWIEKQDRVCLLKVATLPSAESCLQDDITQLFEKYGVRDNIDILHKIVTEAKARKDVTKDIWREDIQPRNAVYARTIPVLEAETAQLEEILARVIELARS